MKSDDALQGLVNFLKRKNVESNKVEDEFIEGTEKAKRQKIERIYLCHIQEENLILH